jgi:hypothetical protein
VRSGDNGSKVFSSGCLQDAPKLAHGQFDSDTASMLIVHKLNSTQPLLITHECCQVQQGFTAEVGAQQVMRWTVCSTVQLTAMSHLARGLRR